MSAVWVMILGLTAANAIIKAAGPLALGGRPLPRPLAAAIPVLASALLAALVVVETAAGEDRSLVLDQRAFGVLAAVAAIAARRSLVTVVVVAAAVTALARALG